MGFFILHGLLLTGIAHALSQRYRPRPLGYFFILGLLLKLMAALAYGWIYFRYYGATGDSIAYFRNAAVLTQLAYDDWSAYWRVFWQSEYQPYLAIDSNFWSESRALFMVKLVSLAHFLTGSSYLISSFYISFLSYWGMWRLADYLAQRFPQNHYAALVGFLLFPSVLLWSSGLSKESFAMAALGWGISLTLELNFKPHKSWQWYLKAILGIGMSLVVLLLMKYYYLAAAFPVLLSFSLCKLLQDYFAKYRSLSFGFLLALYMAILALGAGLASQLHPVLQPSYIMLALVYNHNKMYNASHPDDLIHYHIYGSQGYVTLDATWQSYLGNAPKAVYSAMLRPFIWEAGGNKLKILMGLENLLVLALLLFAVFYSFKQGRNWHISNIEGLLLLTAGIYIILLMAMMAFASPNFGALARYRIGALPFFIYLLLIPANLAFGSKAKKLSQKILFWKSFKR